MPTGDWPAWMTIGAMLVVLCATWQGTVRRWLRREWN